MPNEAHHNFESFILIDDEEENYGKVYVKLEAVDD